MSAYNTLQAIETQLGPLAQQSRPLPQILAATAQPAATVTAALVSVLVPSPASQRDARSKLMTAAIAVTLALATVWGSGLLIGETRRPVLKPMELVTSAPATNAPVVTVEPSMIARPGKPVPAVLPKLAAIVREQPTNVAARRRYAYELAEAGRYAEALEQYRQVVRLAPHDFDAINNLASLLATCPDAGLRDGREALRLAHDLCQITGDSNPYYLGTLAAAYAEVGDFTRAVKSAELALRVALARKDKTAAKLIRQQAFWFAQGFPYRMAAGGSRPASGYHE